jgi:hypothetical protein
MPKAMAPKAPWVEVCESPQTMVMPGWVALLGADDVHDALAGSPIVAGDAELGGVGPQRVDLLGLEIGSAIGWSMFAVGTLWSIGGHREVGAADGAAG